MSKQRKKYYGLKGALQAGIDVSPSLRDKLFEIMCGFCGLEKVIIRHTEVHQVFDVELTFKGSYANKLISCYEYRVSINYNEHTCTVKVRSVTNIEQLYIKLIKDLT